MAKYADNNESDLTFREGTLDLTEFDKRSFSELLHQAAGDNLTPEMQRTLLAYHNAVDQDIYDFVNDVLHNRDVLPITVGFVTECMAVKIKELTGLSVEGNRIVLHADDVRHIIRRHGEQGKADHSMKDVKDIARLSYVLSHYDSILWDGGVSRMYRTRDGKPAPQLTVIKRINGTYYVIEVISDAVKKRNVVVSAYLKKATDDDIK